MRLVTFRRIGASDGGSVGALSDDGVTDLSATAGSMVELLERGPVGSGPVLPLDEVELLPPLPRPNSIRDFMLIEEHVRNSFGEVVSKYTSDASSEITGQRSDAMSQPGNPLDGVEA